MIDVKPKRHKEFGLKPSCCTQPMIYQESDDGPDWFECIKCGSVRNIPENYWNDTPKQYTSY